MDFHVLLLIHFVSLGLFLTLQQRAARHGMDPWVLNYATAASAALCTLPFAVHWLAQPGNVADAADVPTWKAAAVGAGIALVGAAYSLLTYTRLRAQSLLPGHVYAPLSRLGLPIVLVCSIVIFAEERSPLQWVAIAVAFAPLTYFQAIRGTKATPGRQHVRAGIAWAAIGALLSAGLQLSSKFILDSTIGLKVPVELYVVGSNLGGTVASAGVCIQRGDFQRSTRRALGWGAACGVLNAFAFYSLSEALVGGQASIVYPVSALAIIVPTGFAAALDKHRISITEGLMTLVALAATVVIAMD